MAKRCCDTSSDESEYESEFDSDYDSDDSSVSCDSTHCTKKAKTCKAKKATKKDPKKAKKTEAMKKLSKRLKEDKKKIRTAMTDFFTNVLEAKSDGGVDRATNVFLKLVNDFADRVAKKIKMEDK